MKPFRQIAMLLAALAISLCPGISHAAITITSPTFLNPDGSPAVIMRVLFINPDGSLATIISGAAASTAGATPVTTASSITTLKTTAGNLYGVNVVNGITAGFLIAVNIATAPVPTDTIAPSTILWSSAVAASLGVSQVFNPPITASAGIHVLFSTSMTTYTVPAVLPMALTGYYK